MRFLCDSCGTKYSISDERVRGRVLKIRCKKCDFVITVREDLAAAGPLGVNETTAYETEGEQTVVGGLDSVGLGSGKARVADAGEKDDWYLSFDGEQEGPLSLKAALGRVQEEKGTGKEVHAWRPGFLVWLPIEEVPELVPPRVADKPAARPPVRATTPTPVGGVRATGSVSSQVSRDPSGPRAALSVSAGAGTDAARAAAPSAGQAPGQVAAPLAAGPSNEARLDLRKSAAPPIPSAARGPIKSLGATRSPVAGAEAAAPAAPINGGPSGPNRSGARPAPPVASAAPLGAVAQAAPTSASQPMLAAAAAPTKQAAPEPAFAAAPDLPISNEASGLVDLAKLASVAMGKPVQGQAFINGHTGRTGRVPMINAPEPLSALDPVENPTAPAPVVVVAGAASSGTSPVFKYVAIASVLGLLGLGGAVVYLLTHRPEAETIIVTEPSRRADDSPITVADPAGAPKVADPKKPAAAGSRRLAAAAKGVAPAPAPAKSSDNLSGSQRALADLYKDDGDRATPRGIPGAGAGRGSEGGQVSQSAIIAAVTANKRTLSLCYERALKHDQSLKSGRVPIQVTVGMSGRVTAVSIPEAQYASSELGQCFVQAVKRWNFPAADAAYSTEFPFILQAQ